MDRVKPILFVAGIGCFVFSVVLSGLYPWLISGGREPEHTLEQVSANVTPEFRELKAQFPVKFDAAFPEAAAALSGQELAKLDAMDARRAASEKAWQAAHAKALRRGRDIYIAEACWHCHSQFVRPVANEEQRFGRIRTMRDDNNTLQRPMLWGTRRVGPDLTNEGGLRSNDWHMAHLVDPSATSPGSIMPRYTWMQEKGWQIRATIDSNIAAREGLPEDTSHALPGVYPTQAEAEAALKRLQDAPPANMEEEVERLFVTEAMGPTADALALIAYLQWLGRWQAPVAEGTR
jgi:cbb3-type cytochrome c oxidase subunit II